MNTLLGELRWNILSSIRLEQGVGGSLQDYKRTSALISFDYLYKVHQDEALY